MKDEAELLKKAFDTNAALLSAEKIEVRVLDDGTVITVPVPDNPVRQRAVESVFDVVGAKRNTKSDSDGSGPKLVLVLPDYYSPEFIAKETKIVDVTATTVESEDGSGEGYTASGDVLDVDVSDEDGNQFQGMAPESDAESILKGDEPIL